MGNLALFIALHLMASAVADACTTAAYLSAHGQQLIGKSLDWGYGHGFVATNPRGAKKTALLLPVPGKKLQPLSWTSQLGNVTFNQVSRDFPFGGMNEAGLMIEVMWLTESVHPPLRQDVPTINEAQFIQYILDQAANTAAAIALVKGIQIQKGAATIHYLLCDREQSCAVIEYVKGERRIYSGESLPYSALTNNNYEASLDHLKEHNGFGGATRLPDESRLDSLSRFVKATSESQKTEDPAGGPVRKGFDLLEKVMVPSTQWQIVYQPQQKQIAFRTRDSLEIKTVDLSKLNFDCSSGQRYVRMNSGSGEISSRFAPISHLLSKEYVEKSNFLQPKIKKLIIDFDKKKPLSCQ